MRVSGSNLSMLKNRRCLQKTVLLFFMYFLFYQPCLTARPKIHPKAQQSNMILDQHNKPLSFGAVPEAGQSRLKKVRIMQDGAGTLSKKIVLSFQVLQGFSYKTKKTLTGKIIHSLVFEGVDEKCCDFNKLGQMLTQMTLKQKDRPAFERFSLRPSVKKQGAHNYLPQLQMLVEHDPAKVCVKISQAAGQEEVEIEIFDRSLLQQVAYTGNSTIKHATHVANPGSLLSNFSGNFLLRV